MYYTYLCYICSFTSSSASIPESKPVPATASSPEPDPEEIFFPKVCQSFLSFAIASDKNLSERFATYIINSTYLYY
jgi:hypothetical protein